MFAYPSDVQYRQPVHRSRQFGTSALAVIAVKPMLHSPLWDKEALGLQSLPQFPIAQIWIVSKKGTKIVALRLGVVERR